MSSRCHRSCKPNGQVSSAAHNVKTPKQSHRKFKGAPDPPYRAHGVAAGGAAFTVKYDALTRQRWLPSRQFGKPVYLHGAGVMAQRLSRRVSGFNSPYAGPHFMVLFMKKALSATRARIDYAPVFAGLNNSAPRTDVHWGAFSKLVRTPSLRPIWRSHARSILLRSMSALVTVTNGMLVVSKVRYGGTCPWHLTSAQRPESALCCHWASFIGRAR